MQTVVLVIYVISKIYLLSTLENYNMFNLFLFFFFSRTLSLKYFECQFFIKNLKIDILNSNIILMIKIILYYIKL